MFSIGDSYRMIKDGYQDIVFAGGIDTNVGNFSHIILDAVGALNIHQNEDPSSAVKPFDQERRGAV
jgi:3-oxoacyl-[acyl-carrier-protein] synthase II